MRWISFLYLMLECVLVCIIFIWPVIVFMTSDNISELKSKWGAERCNPYNIPYYPLVSENMTQDATYCVQNVMANSMGPFLQPLTFMFSTLADLGGSLTSQLQDVRNMFNYIRTEITSIIQSVLSIFLNMIIQFQKILIAIKDIMAKIVGIFVSLLYVLDGTVLLVESGWNGVPGQMVRALGSIKLGSCFAPETKIMLQSGDVKKISDISLGDVLINGSVVEGTMQLLNSYDECYYELPNGVNNEPIYVTGTHYVYDKNDRCFKIVEKLKDAKLTNKKDEVYYCLITSNNMIPIGDYLFWDWEDYKINRLCR
jgi:hypothetical protein